MKYKDKIDVITKQFKKMVEKKYNIVEMKLFGSSARGEHTKYSDIDIMIKLPVVTRGIEEDLFSIAYDLELKYDCLINVIVIPSDFSDNIPLYRKIEKEGIAI